MKLLSIPIAIFTGVVGSLLLSAVCIIALFLFFLLFAWTRSNPGAAFSLNLLGFFIDILSKILWVASIPGIILMTIVTLFAPAMGAGLYARIALRKAAKKGTFNGTPGALAGFCGIVAFAVVAAVADTAWDIARDAGNLPDFLLWEGSFYSNGLVLGVLIFGILVAGYYGAKDSEDNE